MSNNNRSRTFVLNLYPNEDETHRNALDHIIQNYEYAYIVHDKDYDKETGELLKPHTHCVLRFPNTRTLKSLADELKITPNYIEKANSYNSSLLYLIHYRNAEKHQYNLDEVQGPLKKKLVRLIKNENKEDEDDVILEIIGYIDNYKNLLSVRNLSDWIVKNGYWAYYRRNAYIINSIIAEHNADIEFNDRTNYRRKFTTLKESEDNIDESNMD